MLYPVEIGFCSSLPEHVPGHVAVSAVAMTSVGLEPMLQWQHNCSRVVGNCMGSHAEFQCATG